MRELPGKRPILPMMRRCAAVSVVAGLAMWSFGCSDGPDMPDAFRPWALGSSWLEVRLEAVSAEDLPISEVRGLAADSKGFVYVRDRLTRGVMVLRPDLTYETTIGREGEGSGEFELVSQVQILESDSVWVYDAAADRMSVFAPRTYEVAYTRRTPSDAGLLAKFPRINRYLAIARRAYFASSSEPDPGPMNRLFAVDDSGSVVNPPALVVPAPANLILRRDGFVSMRPHPYGHELFYAALPAARFAYADSHAMSVATVGLDGEQVASFSYPVDPFPVSTSELQAEIENSPDFADLLREGAPYAHPVLAGLVPDDEGRIWTGIRAGAADPLWEWAAFSQDGVHGGSVQLPAGMLLHAVRDGMLYASVRDELDVPSIHAYRVLKASGR